MDRHARRFLSLMGSVLVIMLVIAISQLVPFSPAPAQAAEVVIKAIMAWPQDCNCVVMYKRYIEEVNKRGKG